MGAAYFAGLAVGYWKDLEEIRANWAMDRCFRPEISPEERKVRIHGWKKAASKAGLWAKD
jgi:glycerol kinase